MRKFLIILCFSMQIICSVVGEYFYPFPLKRWEDNGEFENSGDFSNKLVSQDLQQYSQNLPKNPHQNFQTSYQPNYHEAVSVENLDDLNNSNDNDSVDSRLQKIEVDTQAPKENDVVSNQDTLLEMLKEQIETYIDSKMSENLSCNKCSDQTKELTNLKEEVQAYVISKINEIMPKQTSKLLKINNAVDQLSIKLEIVEQELNNLRKSMEMVNQKSTDKIPALKFTTDNAQTTIKDMTDDAQTTIEDMTTEATTISVQTKPRKETSSSIVSKLVNQKSTDPTFEFMTDSDQTTIEDMNTEATTISVQAKPRKWTSSSIDSSKPKPSMHRLFEVRSGDLS